MPYRTYMEIFTISLQPIQALATKRGYEHEGYTVIRMDELGLPDPSTGMHKYRFAMIKELSRALKKSGVCNENNQLV